VRRQNRPKGLHLVQRGRIWHITGTYSGVRVRRSTGETDPDRAHRLLVETIDEIAANRYGTREDRLAAAQNGQKAATTFSEAAQAYLDKNKNTQSKSTRRQVEAIIKKIGDKVTCEEITWPFLTEFRKQFFIKDVSDSTFKRQVVAPIKAVLNWAAINLGRAQGCFPPLFEKIADGERRTICLRPDDAAAMLQRALAQGDHTLATTLVFGVCEGPRRGDMFKLDWKDIDLKRHTCLLLDVKSSKGRVRDRWIGELRPRTVQMLSDYKARTGCLSGPVFRTPNGTPFADVDAFGKAMNEGLARIAKELEIPDAGRITLHVLRHTSASWHYAVCLDVIRVQVRGDWRNIKSVMRYVHLLPEGLAPSVEAFWRGPDEARI
jgi:integrase